MSRDLAERFLNEQRELQGRAEHIRSAAAEHNGGQGRDLSEQDIEMLDEIAKRMETVKTQLRHATANFELDEDVQDSLARYQPGMVQPATVQYRTAGDLVWDMLHQEDHQARDRYGRYMKRAAEHMGLDKANTVAVAGGFNGLVVAPVTGAVLDPRPEGRPLFTALGPRPITSFTFMRPRIVDPNFATGVAPQGQEKAELASKAWDILAEQVTAQIVGGYINVSELLTEMLAGSLDMVVSHMNARLEADTEAYAVTEVERTTATVPLAPDADAAAVQQAIAQAAALVYRNTGRLPTWIAMGVDFWARIMALTDAAGRPLFPAIGPANAPGTTDGATSFGLSVMGLQGVVSFGITDGSAYVGNSFGLEVYERRLPLMQVLEPALRGRQISVASAIASYRPITKEAVTGGTPAPAETNGIVRIGS